MSSSFSIQSLLEQTRAATAATTPAQEGQREKLARLAQEFESLLMLQMVRTMRMSMLDEPEQDDLGLGKGTYTDVFDQELTRHLSQSGGYGLTDHLLKAFDRQYGENPTPGVGAPTGLGAVPLQNLRNSEEISRVPHHGHVHAAGTADAPGEVSLVGGAAVTSAFGWRQDPFHGHTKFHAGIDLRAAYGQVVPSVSEGRVTMAGEQGAYGLTVVVDHGNGLTTRYAHLSAIEVQVGDRIDAGQHVGRVGQTGRATAPHLHFEVLRNGRAMDPAQAAEHFSAAGLKLVSLDVD